MFATLCILCFLFNGILTQTDYLKNWKNRIDPEMLEQPSWTLDQSKAYSKNFQGDISGLRMDDIDPHDKNAVKMNNAISDVSKRWPNGVVPYEISPTFLSEDLVAELTLIRSAMRQITSLTQGCVKFVKRTTQDDYIFISRGLDCHSAVGKKGGKQWVVYTVGCLDKRGQIQHELMHALGFYHEMSRGDRDEFVWINWSNVQEKFKADFAILTDSLDFGIPYDYESVLHYPHNAFAINMSAPTVVPKKGQHRMGQQEELSFNDIMKLKRAYGCPDFTDKSKADDIVRTNLGNERSPAMAERTTKREAVQLVTPKPVVAQKLFTSDISSIPSSLRQGGMTGVTCPSFVSRVGWNARSPKGREMLVRPIANAVFLHTDTPSCDDLEACAKLVRNMQNAHMDTRKWDDIGYNFLIGGDGSVFEGRGWYNKGAFDTRYNSRGYGIVFIGRFGPNTTNMPTSAAIRSAKQLIECGVDGGHLSADHASDSVYMKAVR